MFLNEPARTDYDLNFSVAGVPVRVHPAFFVLPVFLGRGLMHPDLNTGINLLLVIAVFFLSVLVHELGHVMAYRYYGRPGRIVLYWMGGLAIQDSGNLPWARTSSGSFTPDQQIAVSLAGPIAGFLLAFLLVSFVYVCGGSVHIHWAMGFIPLPLPDFTDTVLEGKTFVQTFIFSGILLNVFLNVLNLAPILPLDGGRVARELFVKADPWNGIKNSLMLSIGVGVLLALIGLRMQDQFLAFFFGFMAWSNYQTLQQSGGSRRPW